MSALVYIASVVVDEFSVVLLVFLFMHHMLPVAVALMVSKSSRGYLLHFTENFCCFFSFILLQLCNSLTRSETVLRG